MKRIVLFCLGVFTAVSFSQTVRADVFATGRCNSAGPGVYELNADFTKGYPSIGTDYGGRNFSIGWVQCNGRSVPVQVLSVDSYRVRVALNGGGGRRDFPNDERGGGRGGDGRGGDGGWGRGGDNCVIDASMRWQTTRFYCR